MIMNKHHHQYKIHQSFTNLNSTPATYFLNDQAIFFSHALFAHRSSTTAAPAAGAALGPPSIRKQTQINTFNTYTKHTSITQQRTAHLLSSIFIATGMEIDQQEDYIL